MRGVMVRGGRDEGGGGMVGGGRRGEKVEGEGGGHGECTYYTLQREHISVDNNSQEFIHRSGEGGGGG